MTTTTISTCPVCGQTPFSVENNAPCAGCGLSLSRSSWPVMGTRYTVKAIGAGYSLVKPGLLGKRFTAAQLSLLAEQVYSDQTLAAFAGGDFGGLKTPAGTLAGILLEQLKETCFLRVNGLRRAHGPVLAEGSDRLPRETAPAGIDWQDQGNLFLTDSRLVFPSNTFTFIRMDRKLVGVKAFKDGLAVQRKGETFATYFVGCPPYQAALAAAYIEGRLPGLREAPAQQG